MDSVEEAVREELVSGDGNTGTVVDERVNWSYLVAKRHSGGVKAEVSGSR